MATVLAIDDTLVNLVLFEGLLRKLPDVTSVSFTLPAEALAWSAAETPDLVVVDYMMPDIDGIEFIRRFRALPGKSEIPVLMVTANHEKSVCYQALEAGASDFLTKPVDKTEFIARSRNMLALRDGQKKLADHAAWLADEVDKATHAIVDRERETIVRLSRLAEYRDPETGGHIQRMAHYSKMIASRLGLSARECGLIFEAAPLHDIGKVAVPDSVLLKPGKLDEEEFESMKKHTLIGHEILKGSESEMLRAGAVIALSHHEKYDGTGYPHGLRGEEVPLHGRIVAVADVFDALTSTRPYKTGWPLDRAQALLREESGRHFDPACVDVFLASWNDVLEIRESLGETQAEGR